MLFSSSCSPNSENSNADFFVVETKEEGEEL